MSHGLIVHLSFSSRSTEMLKNWSKSMLLKLNLFSMTLLDPMLASGTTCSTTMTMPTSLWTITIIKLSMVDHSIPLNSHATTGKEWHPSLMRSNMMFGRENFLSQLTSVPTGYKISMMEVRCLSTPVREWIAHTLTFRLNMLLTSTELLKVSDHMVMETTLFSSKKDNAELTPSISTTNR